MAVALVIGQAMLCALIGWLTLGPSRSGPHRPGTAIDQVAPPVVPGPVATVSRSAAVPGKQPRRPSSAAPARPRVTTAREVPAPAVTTTSPARPPVPINLPPADDVPPSGAPAPPPATPAPSAPVPPSDAPRPPVPSGTAGAPDVLDPDHGVIQQPVVVGAVCQPLGAYGRTAEGELVRCLRDWRHRPRWKIV